MWYFSVQHFFIFLFEVSQNQLLKYNPVSSTTCWIPEGSSNWYESESVTQKNYTEIYPLSCIFGFETSDDGLLMTGFTSHLCKWKTSVLQFGILFYLNITSEKIGKSSFSRKGINTFVSDHFLVWHLSCSSTFPTTILCGSLLILIPNKLTKNTFAIKLQVISLAEWTPFSTLVESK